MRGFVKPEFFKNSNVIFYFEFSVMGQIIYPYDLHVSTSVSSILLSVYQKIKVPNSGNQFTANLGAFRCRFQYVNLNGLESPIELEGHFN